MIRQYEVEDIIEIALCNLNGILSKPDDKNECTMFEAYTDKPQRGEILFSFKEDIMSDENPDKFRIRIEDVTFDIEKQDVKKYQMEHPVYSPMTPSINTKCPVGYDWFKCSSKEKGMYCRTCANYNPLRMLYEKELKTGIKLGVPLQVLWADAEIQLEHEEKIEGLE